MSKKVLAITEEAIKLLIEKVKKGEDLTYTEENDLYEFLRNKVRAHPMITITHAQEIGKSYDEHLHDATVFTWTYLKDYDPTYAISTFVNQTVNSYYKNELTTREKLQTKIPPSKIISLSDQLSQSTEGEEPLTFEEILKVVGLTAEEEIIAESMYDEILKELKSNPVAVVIFTRKLEGGTPETEIAQELGYSLAYIRKIVWNEIMPVVQRVIERYK